MNRLMKLFVALMLLGAFTPRLVCMMDNDKRKSVKETLSEVQETVGEVQETVEAVGDAVEEVAETLEEVATKCLPFCRKLGDLFKACTKGTPQAEPKKIAKPASVELAEVKDA